MQISISYRGRRDRDEVQPDHALGKLLRHSPPLGTNKEAARTVDFRRSLRCGVGDGVLVVRRSEALSKQRDDAWNKCFVCLNDDLSVAQSGDAIWPEQKILCAFS